MDRKDKEILYFGIVVSVLVLTYVWVTQSKKAEMLSKNTKIDYGFFESYKKKPRGHQFKYSYIVRGKKYILSTIRGDHFLQIKDTVLIKYSLKDPTYCEVEDVFYMKKYKGLRRD